MRVGFDAVPCSGNELASEAILVKVGAGPACIVEWLRCLLDVGFEAIVYAILAAPF